MRTALLAATIAAASPGLAAGRASAEPASSLAPTVSGFVDVTYTYDFDDPAGGVVPYHAYTARHDTLLVDTAHLAVAGGDAHLAYDVELDTGSVARVDSGTDREVDVQEAYVTYAHASGVGVRLGKWATYQGVEVIESGANPTISRGLLFVLAEPFTHVGAVATYRSGDVDVAAGVVNGWDVEVDNNSLRTFVVKLGLTTDRLLLTASAYAGPERAGDNHAWRVNGDLTGAWRLRAADLWFQVNAGTEQGAAPDGGTATWAGATVQPVVHVGGALAVGARVEALADPDGARSGTAQTLVDVSVAPAWTVYRTFVLRAEARVDVSSSRPFVDRAGDAHRAQVIALTEALVSF